MSNLLLNWPELLEVINELHAKFIQAHKIAPNAIIMNRNLCTDLPWKIANDGTEMTMLPTEPKIMGMKVICHDGYEMYVALV